MSVQLMDNVTCNDCGFDGFVALGEDVCPQCKKKGYLAWKEGELEVVEVNIF